MISFIIKINLKILFCSIFYVLFRALNIKYKFYKMSVVYGKFPSEKNKEERIELNNEDKSCDRFLIENYRVEEELSCS